MKRLLEEKLLKWKQSTRRKPLIVRGIRQSGKTWLLKEFGQKHYEDIAYFNFENNTALSKLFQKNLDPKRLITELGIVNNKAIQPEKSLIIFDEIQFCGQAITSLKYFFESAPQYHIACAGSLLGIALARPASYPVGKVDMLTLNSMSFYEFLQANGEDILIEYLTSEIIKPEPVSEIFTDKLQDYLKIYYITGGMPEAVYVWLETKDIAEIETVQQNILNLYELDFAKYAPTADIPKLSMIWNSISSQLAKENRKFVYGLLREGAGARAFESAITWLQNAGMVYNVCRIEKPNIPLKSYVNKSHFKLYLPDVGLLRKMSGLSAKSILEEDSLYREFKGVMAENYCLQELVSLNGDVPFYWSSGNLAEIDFVVQFIDKIVPIEVKAADNVKSKSLAVYRKKYEPIISVKTSQRNLNYTDGLLNCPLYLLWKLPEFIKDL
jgi:predicted AAA+ superfamily ATPase